MKIKPQHDFIYAGVHASIWGKGRRSYEAEWGEVSSWDIFIEKTNLPPRWHHDGTFREGSERNFLVIFGNRKAPFRASYESQEVTKEHITHHGNYYFTLEDIDED